MVLLNNLQERNDAKEVNGLLTSIYKDRLVVENFNYNLLDNMHRIVLLTSDTRVDAIKSKEVKNLIENIRHVIFDYRNTYLTMEEEENLNNIFQLTFRLNSFANRGDYASCNKMATESLPILNDLSLIQISEGKAIKNDADKLFSSSKVTSEFEFAMIIVIGLIIQALVFSSKTINIASNVPHQLN